MKAKFHTEVTHNIQDNVIPVKITTTVYVRLLKHSL